MAGLCAWVAIGGSWAPLRPAQDDLIRDLLYLAGLLLAITAWRRRDELRRVEPVLAAGTLVVVGYGLAGRLLPDLVEQQTIERGRAARTSRSPTGTRWARSRRWASCSVPG